MENFVTLFNAEAEGRRRFIPLADLEKGKEYPIAQIRMGVSTKGDGGKILKVDIDTLRWTILPTTLADMVTTEEKLNELNNTIGGFIYVGQDMERNKKHLFKFIPRS